VRDPARGAGFFAFERFVPAAKLSSARPFDFAQGKLADGGCPTFRLFSY
jgi:hypothetical protein